MTSTCSPSLRRRTIAGPACFSERPPPAAGLTMARKRSFKRPRYSDREICLQICLQGQNRSCAVEQRKALRQSIPFYLKGGRTGKVFVKEDDPVDALVV